MEIKKRKRQKKVFATTDLQRGFMSSSIHEGCNHKRSQSIKDRKYYAGTGVDAVEIAYRFVGFIWEHPVSNHLCSPPHFSRWIKVKLDVRNTANAALETDTARRIAKGEEFLDPHNGSEMWVYRTSQSNPKVFCVPRKPLDLEAHEENVSYLRCAIEGFNVRRVSHQNTIDYRLGLFKAAVSRLKNYCNHFNLPVPEHIGVDELAGRANSRKVALMITKGVKYDVCSGNE